MLVTVPLPAAQCIFARGASANLNERSKANTITIVSTNLNPIDLTITDIIPVLHDEGCFSHARGDLNRTGLDVDDIPRGG